ncbi:MAG: carbohydrate-binding protein [Paludibacter sp.]
MPKTHSFSRKTPFHFVSVCKFSSRVSYEILLSLLFLVVPLFAFGQFYVSSSGSDNNAGTLSAPFLTLEKARTAMRASSTKTTYLRAGTYLRTTTFLLDVNDNGTTWACYPGDALDSPIIDGNGIQDVIHITGGNNISINGLTVRNYTSRGIGIHGGSPWSPAAPYGNLTYGIAGGNTITNNIVENGVVPLKGWDRAGIYAMGNVPNTTISHNVVRNTTGYGIGVWDQAPADHDITNLIVSDNVLLNVFRGGTCDDGGAIYVLDQSEKSTNIKITNNFIRDYGDSGLSWGIYLDNNMSNALVSGNIVQGAGAQFINVNGGQNNDITGNIYDMGNSPKVVLAYSMYTFPTPGNKFHNNIILSNTTMNTLTTLVNVSAAINPTIQNNFYYNYNGPVCPLGNLGANDASPVSGWPSISGWTYDIAPGSAVYKAPVSFTPLTRGWGPTGYTIPNTGTAPSCVNATGAVPTTPVSLSATAGNTMTYLRWSPFANATGYKVKRATTKGGPYSNVFSAGTTVTEFDKCYVDKSLTNGVPYYYVVSAITPSGETGNSTEVNVAPSDTVPLRLPVCAITTSSGVNDLEIYIGGCDNGNWVRFDNVNLNPKYTKVRFYNGVDPRYAGLLVEIRLDSPTGTLIGTYTTTSTGGFNTLAEGTTTIVPATGIHSVYFKFVGGSGVGNFYWFQFETGATVAPTSITIPATATVPMGSTLQLTPVISPSNITNKSVTYVSSKTSVTTVSATGLITAVAKGTANISVSTIDRAKTAVCVVTVTDTLTDVSDPQNDLIKIYPNPAFDYVNIELNHECVDEPVKATLLSSNGQIVFQKIIRHSSSYKLSTNYFAKGIYLLEVFTGKQIIRKKLILQ